MIEMPSLQMEETQIQIKDEIYSIQCPICLMEVENIEESIITCSDTSHTCHTACLKHYIQKSIDSAFLGFCPTIKCPSIHTKGSPSILNFDMWSSFVGPELLEKYNQFAGSTLGFLCGGCHSFRSLQVETNPGLTSTSQDRLLVLLSEGNSIPSESPESFNSLLAILRQFGAGAIDVQELYSHILAFFPQLFTLDEKLAWEILKNILQLIPNPERRNLLHLRHLNARPKIFTPCCSREHCFRCRTKDFHTGRTCEQNTAALDSSFLPCPGCGLMLAKGDGCNTVTCVCKRQFSWSEEKESYELSNKFSATFPSNTAWFCAQVLCQEQDIKGNTREAEAWNRKNTPLARQALCSYWRHKFQLGAAQCCALPDIRNKNPGLKLASDLWEAANKTKVEKSKNEINTSKKSLILTMYPSTKEQAEVAAQIRNSQKHFDPLLAVSIKIWADAHPREIGEATRDFNFRSALQFLHLFKHTRVSQTPCFNYHGPMTWDRELSNTYLAFGEDNTTVMRPGGVSSYPACHARLTGTQCSFSVEVVECEKQGNYLTFGVSRGGAFPKESSDGVGMTRDSWGFNDERASSCTNPMKVCGNRERITQCRKIQKGDVLTADIDAREGWLEVSLNGQEFRHRFEIPPGEQDDYKFTMTFANNHKVRIIPPPEESKSQERDCPNLIFLNKQNRTNLDHLKSMLKALASITGPSDLSVSKSSLEESFVPSWGWDKLAEYSEEWKFSVVSNSRVGSLGSAESVETNEVEGNWEVSTSRKSKRKLKKSPKLSQAVQPPPTHPPLALAALMAQNYYTLRPHFLELLGLKSTRPTNPPAHSKRKLLPVDPSALEQLLLMGIDLDQAQAALRRHSNDPARAANFVFDTGFEKLGRIVAEDEVVQREHDAAEEEKNISMEKIKQEKLREKSLGDSLSKFVGVRWEDLRWGELVGALISHLIDGCCPPNSLEFGKKKKNKNNNKKKQEKRYPSFCY